MYFDGALNSMESPISFITRGEPEAENRRPEYIINRSPSTLFSILDTDLKKNRNATHANTLAPATKTTDSAIIGK